MTIQASAWNAGFQSWERAPFRDSVRRKILFDNANALLGLKLAYTGE